MKKKTGFLIFLLITSALILAGCAPYEREPVQERSVYEEYYDARAQYVGSASDVGNLLKVLGAGEYGNYTIALTTDQEPYGITVNYSELTIPESEFTTMERIPYAYHLLALVENVSYADINYNDYTYHLDVEQANEEMGGDIKKYGSSAEMAQELDEKLK